MMNEHKRVNNVYSAILYLQERFDQFGVDELTKSATFQMTKRLRDNLISEGVEENEANRVAITTNIEIDDSVYDLFPDEVENLIDTFSNKLNIVLNLYREEFGLTYEQSADILCDRMYIELTN